MESIIGQLAINGIATGLVYAILAAGLVFILSITGIFYFCYGGFYMLGAYFVWYSVTKLHLSFFPSLLIGGILVALIGVLTYVLIFKKLQKRNEFLAYTVAATALFDIVDQSALLGFGTVPRSIPVVLKGTSSIFGITINNDKLLIIVLGLIITIGLFVLYQKTHVGRAMRAVSYLPEAANLQGINSTKTYFITIAFACLLAGLAGGIIGPSYGIYPKMGDAIIMPVLLIAMFGGLDSLVGAAVGGIIFGLILAFGQYFIGGMVQIFLFLFIGVVVYFRPEGLFGMRTELNIGR